MSLLIKKVFSTKLAKSYWISKAVHPPVKGIPCFSVEEIRYMVENNLNTEELEFCYKAKIENSSFEIIPKSETLPIGTVIPVVETRPKETVSAMHECLNFVLKRANGKKAKDNERDQEPLHEEDKGLEEGKEG